MSGVVVNTERPKRGLKWVFVGTDGLRAGWGVLLFVLVTVVVFLLLALLVHLFHITALRIDPKALKPGTMLTSSRLILAEGFVSACIIAGTLIMSAIERRPLRRYGFGARGAAKRLVQGLATGFLMLSLSLGVIWLCDGVSFQGFALHGAAIASSGVAWAAAFLLVAVSEEFTMRGYVLHTVARGLNFRWAVAITSLVFTALHVPNPGESVLGLTEVFLIALVFCFSIWRTGAVWWAVGYHAAWDWSQTFLFGVADSGTVASGVLTAATPQGPAWLSGGLAGPEGSVVSLGAIAASAAIIMFTLKRDQPGTLRW